MTVFCSSWNDSFVVFSNCVLVSLFQFSCSVKDKLCGKSVIQEYIVYCLGRELSFPRKRESRGVATMREFYVYILTNKRNGTLYIGVTNNLQRRVYEHKNNLKKGFTKKHQLHHLVYFESTEDIRSALQREKQLKKWERGWKIELIEKNNPQWKDLYETLH